MRKIRLSDTDIEFFDMEVSPTEFLFFTKHKDAFRCMWKEQGKPFWTRFIVSFRSYTVKQGVIKQMSFDSPKLNDLLDQGFINIHEQFLEGTATLARSFVDDIARLAQNHDKFPNLDSKNFAKDPFYCRDTRELFRQFFGSPDQKASYLKVYILSPVYLRFGGSVCRCLKRWMDAPPIDLNDDSYWTPPAAELEAKTNESKVIMCSSCLDECGTLFFQEKLCGKKDGPKFIESWTKGDPRLNDKKNPLYNKMADHESDWRSNLTVEDFRDFVYYSNYMYGDKCSDCLSLTNFCPFHNNTEDCEKSTDSPEKTKKKRKKKKKEKEIRLERTDEEIDQLVKHIEGIARLKNMPENTIAGAIEKSPTKETPPPLEEKTDDMKSQVKKEIFTRKAKVSDDFKYGIMPFQDKSGPDLKRSLIGGFKVKRIEDEKTGACEITVTITAIKGENAKDRSIKFPGLDKSDDSGKVNRFPLTAELLKTKMIDLPKKMEWYEGWNWCATVLNFEEEERDLCDKPTNFTIKVTGRDEECVKRTMFKLLFYVIQRKSRPCPGWNMEDDDIVACILPDESTEFEGITICIIRGFRFEERLTDEEKSTMQSPPEECIANPRKVMMTWQPSKARSILRATPAKGRAELKELLLNVGSIVNRVDDIPDDCTPQRRRQLELKIQKQMAVLKARPPRKIDEGPMYKQMKQNPDTFELFIMSDLDKVAELESIGMMAVDVDIDEKNSGNFCDTCGQANASCFCADQSSKKKQLPECNCVNCLKGISVGDLEEDFDNILAKDGIVKKNGKYVAKTPTPEQIEADIQKEHKSIQRVLSDAGKRISIKQQTEKADGRIITKKVAQSVPQAKVIKIDTSGSVDKTIEQIKLKTAIYRHDAKRSEKHNKLMASPEKEGVSELDHEMRQKRIKDLELERAALRKMVLDEKEKEDQELDGRMDAKKKGQEVQETLAILNARAEEEAAKAVGDQEKVVHLIRKNEDKSLLEMFQKQKNVEKMKSQEKKLKEEMREKARTVEEIKTKRIKSEVEIKEKGKQHLEEIAQKEKKEEKDKKEGKAEKKKIEIEIQIPMHEAENPPKTPFKLNEQFVKENPHLLKRIIDAIEQSEAVQNANLLTDDAKARVENIKANNKSNEKAVKVQEKSKPEKVVDSSEHHPCPCCNKQMVPVNEFGEVVQPTVKKKEKKTKAEKRALKAEKRSQELKSSPKHCPKSPKKDKASEENQNASSSSAEDVKTPKKEQKNKESKTKTIEEDKHDASEIKESEKSYNIIKETSTKSDGNNEFLEKILDEAEEKIVLEEYDGMKADIILTGEPQCPCQVRAKELMKEKLKKKNQQQKEPVSTLRKELSHRLNCPKQLWTQEENQTLTTSKPPCLVNDPNIDINEIIEEELIDSFNIKKLTALGMKITQNTITQTDDDSEKPYGFKEKIIASKPWTEERKKPVKEKDPEFERYLKHIDYKQGVKTDMSLQAGDGILDDSVSDQSDGKKDIRNGSSGSNGVSSRLRTCANCGTQEPAPKTYMKCQKCKIEGRANARYYCGRDCQVKDWTARHKKEHRENLI